MIEGRVIPQEYLDDEIVFRDLANLAFFGYPITLRPEQIADIVRRGNRLRGNDRVVPLAGEAERSEEGAQMSEQRSQDRRSLEERAVALVNDLLPPPGWPGRHPVRTLALERAVEVLRLAVEAERDACALIAWGDEEAQEDWPYCGDRRVIAEAIRARKP